MQHFQLKDYSPILTQLKNQKYDFETYKTSYSKRIKLEEQSFFFSDEKTNPKVMNLIKMVRKEADIFIAKDIANGGNIIDRDLTSYEINFSSFIDKPDLKNNTIIKGYKIDLNSAYWKTALNMGVISQETDDYLNNIDFGFDKYGNKRNDKKIKKSARLKSLGALATRKVKDVYKNGELITDEMEVIVNKIHRAVYLNICEQVANAMATICYEFFDNVIKYYWDCVFIDDKIDKKLIIDRLKELGYDCKLEGGETEFIINRHKSAPCITDKTSGKTYAIDINEIIY